MRYLPAVVGHAARNAHAQHGNIAEFDGVVGEGGNRLAEVLADLGVDHVEGGGEFDIAHVVTAQVDVHQARNTVFIFGVFVIGHTLNQGRSAVAHADDRYTYFFVFCMI